MAIENFDEVKTYFEQNADSEDVKNYVGGFLTPDRVNSYLDSDDGKKLLQPKLDANFNKGLSTWKTNNLQKLVDEKYAKLHPAADPKDKALEELKAEIENMKKEKTHETLKNTALKIATEKKLPTDLVDYFLGEDEESTVSNLNKLEDVFSKHDEQIKSDFAKGNSYTPPKTNEPVLNDKEKLKKQIHDIMNKK